MCSDLRSPTEKAVQTHKEWGVSHLIEYRSIDATDVPFTDEFDLVLFKSVLGGIGRDGDKRRQEKAIREIHKALKSGGELFFAENLVASPLHRFLRHRFVQWGPKWRYVSMAELIEFLSPFPEAHYRTVGFSGA